MHPIAPQERTRMVRWCVPEVCIRVTPKPAQDGCTVYDQVTSADEAAMQGQAYSYNQQSLPNRGTCCSSSLPLLRRTRHAWLALGSQWQPAGECQGRPT